jgi:tetratricopeptide (TPR) repeat protein
MRFPLFALLSGLLLAQTSDPVAEGVKALDARQYDLAIEHFTRAISADPSDYGAHFQLGLAYSLAGKDALAVPEYRKSLELRPGVLQAEFNLGTSLFNLGQFAEAADAFTRAVSIDAASAAAELGLGRALARLNRRSEAEPHYRKAGALDAANREFLLELATLYEENHQPAEAIAIYREFPRDAGATERMGLLLLRAGRLPEAVAALESAVAMSATPANRVALAEAYAKSNQPAKAESQAAEALQATPEDFDLRMFYGQLLRDQRKFLQAAQQFQSAARQKPDSAPAWTELAGVLVMAEQLPAALAALDRVRALNAETAGHYFLRAIVLDRLQQHKEALESYRRFLAGSQGKNPDQEFQARQRILALEKATGKR